MATDAGYTADARAVETSQVLQVQKSGFVALLRRQPELALKILASMALHLRVLVGQLEDLMLKDFETRLANWFVKRCPDPDGTEPVSIKLAMPKRVLAAELGTVSEIQTIYRTGGLNCRSGSWPLRSAISRPTSASFSRGNTRPAKGNMSLSSTAICRS